MIYGLIGEKLSHSFSKEIHNMLGNSSYELCEISPENLDSFMREKDFTGINVTIPYKKKVMPYLDIIDKNAENIGAVNTIVNKDGVLYGYNTDFYGLRNLIVRTLAGKGKTDLKGEKVLIFGTGGTSETAYFTALSLLADDIRFVSRNPSGNQLSYSQSLSYGADVLINTTPVGMYPDVESTPVELSDFDKRPSLVIDVVYNPLRTRLIQSAEKLGITASDGLYMLVNQAVCADKLFHGTADMSDIESAERIYNSVLKKKRNIVLVGLPGCGKSTIGKMFAQRHGLRFFDSDEEIEKETGLTPRELIEIKGEEYFRNIESRIIASLSLSNGVVISTGGGAVIRAENRFYLKANSLVFFLDRNIDFIKPTAGRPLSDSHEKLVQLKEKRYGLYQDVTDHTIKTNENKEDTIKQIANFF